MSKTKQNKMEQTITRSKGKKGTICDSDLTMERKSNDLFDISKSFLGLYLNKKQARDLYKWLGKQLNLK